MLRAITVTGIVTKTNRSGRQKRRLARSTLAMTRFSTEVTFDHASTSEVSCLWIRRRRIVGAGVRSGVPDESSVLKI